jgi:carbon storage regulator
VDWFSGVEDPERWSQKGKYATANIKEDWIVLVLSRKSGEAIVIGNGITVTVLEVHGERVRLGFSAPADIPIHREELQRKLEAGLSEIVQG